MLGIITYVLVSVIRTVRLLSNINTDAHCGMHLFAKWMDHIKRFSNDLWQTND